MLENKNKLIIFAGVVIVLGVVIGVVLALRKAPPDQDAGQEVARQGQLPENIVVNTYEQDVYGFSFTRPKDWHFVDVGLPTRGVNKSQDQQIRVFSESTDLPVRIYLALGDKKEPDLVMDLEVEPDFDDDDLPIVAYEQRTTKSGLRARLHEGDCSVNDEPWLYLRDERGRSLFVVIDELCEEENWDQVDMQSLLINLSNNFQFTSEPLHL